MEVGADQIRYPFEQPPAEGQAIEVAPGILWLRLPLPLRLDHVNVYALRESGPEGDGWTVIDTGFDTPKAREIWQDLLAGPLEGLPIQRIIVTHYHPDHVGLAGWLHDRFGAEIWTTQASWLYSRLLYLDEHALPQPETLAHWRAGGMDQGLYDRLSRERPFNFIDVVAPLPLGYRRIAQGDTVTLGGRVWDVHVGHGHAPEHATFWCRDEALVLAGDQILPSISPNLSLHATEPEADPVAEWLESCARLARLGGPRHLILPGHKLPFRGLPMRMTQLIENHHGALARTLDALDVPRTAAECFLPIFKRHIEEPVYVMALGEAMAHLNWLKNAGLVSRQRDAGGTWRWQRCKTVPRAAGFG